MDLHTGQIDLKSQTGKGSEFMILLPSIKKTLRNALYQLNENGQTTNVVTKAAEPELIELAKSLNIVAQWKSLQQDEIKLILKEIEMNY